MAKRKKKKSQQPNMDTTSLLLIVFGIILAFIVYSKDYFASYATEKA